MDNAESARNGYETTDTILRDSRRLEHPSIRHVLLALYYTALFHIGSALSIALGYLILGSVYFLVQSWGSYPALMDRIKLIFGILVLVQISSLFILASNKRFGIAILRSECKELYELVDGVAEQLHVHSFDRIYVQPDTYAAVLETGVLPFRPIKKRNLMIGWLLLTTLSKQELSAVIAHELAHFENNAMFLHRSLNRIRVNIRNSYRVMYWMQLDPRLQKHAASAGLRGLVGVLLVIPWTWAIWLLVFYSKFVEAYLKFLNERNKEISHQAECYCDKTSATHYGANAILMALRRSVIADLTFKDVLSRFRSPIVKNSNCYPLFHEIMDNNMERFTPSEYEQLIPDSNTHPSFDARTRNLQGIKTIDYPPESLLLKYNSYAELERKLTRLAMAIPVSQKTRHSTSTEESR